MRERHEFAGVAFTGHAHSSSHVTVPVPAFKKILKSGKARVHLCYDIEHDGNGSNDRSNESVKAESFCLEALNKLEKLGRPWLLYLIPADPMRETRAVLHYSPHSNLSYTLVEVVQ